jgi:CDGSH-type Zn-finger protein
LEIVMSDVVINVRQNGPFLVEGPVTIVDHQGNKFTTTPGKAVALCRCAQSSRRPFCDGAHKACGFMAGETAPPPPPSA